MDIDLLILLPPYSDIPRQFFTDVVTIFDVGIVVMEVEQVLGPNIFFSVVHSQHQLLADHLEFLWSKQIVNDDNAVIDKGLDMT